jgi:hypothetical protein
MKNAKVHPWLIVGSRFELATMATLTAHQIESTILNAVVAVSALDCWKLSDNTARRIRTKVLIDTFVQWFRLCVSGLITAVDTGLIQIAL